MSRGRAVKADRRTASPLSGHDDVAAVEAALRQADFPLAHALLARAVPVRGRSGALALVRARLARIEGDLSAWEAAASDAVAGAANVAEGAFARALLAGAYKRTGRPREAAEALAHARAALGAAHPEDTGEATYALAVYAWEERRYDDAATLVERNVRAAVHLAESRALLGWIEIKRERYAQAATHFTQALADLDADGEGDVRLRARLVHALGIVATETIDLRLARRVERAYDQMAWKPALAVERFNALTCLRFVSLLEGDLDGAWLRSRDAAALAPPGPYAAIGETNAAVASALVGDRAGGAVQMRRAWDVLRAVRWGAVDHEGRVALTNFAIEAARSMPPEARQAMTVYRSLRGKANPLNALDDDRRVAAFERLAGARVSEALGDRRGALALYRESLGLWTELGYTMRAALTALDERRLGGGSAQPRAVREALRRAPHAWFGRDARGRDPLERLTPAERGVLRELLRGRTARAIAETLERSPYTVTNHTRKIFAAFGVSSRAQLMARCSELGITVTSDRLRKSSSGRPSR